MLAIPLQRLSKQALGLTHTTALRRVLRESAPRGGKIAVVPRGTLEAFDRIVELARIDQQIAQVQVRTGSRRIDEQRAFEADERLCAAPELLERRAEVVPGIRVRWLALDRRAELNREPCEIDPCEIDHG
jgi:hypothetical protein